MEKKNTGMKVAIVILCLLVVGLTGYIVYDKVLNDNNKSSNNGNVINNNSEDNTVKFLEQVEGVWGYNYYFIKINKENNEYFYTQGQYGTDGIIYGVIKNVTEISKNEFKLEVFINGCTGNDCIKESSDETKYMTLKLDNTKNVIVNNGNKYQFITKDFSNDELIRDFFY